MSIRPFSLAVLLAVGSVPALASAADSSGLAGYVTSLTINQKTSDSYGNYRGSIVVREGTEPASATREYRWGGTLCSGRDLSDADVHLLVQALRGRADTQVLPRYKMGQAGTRCLVSFTLKEPVFDAPR